MRRTLATIVGLGLVVAGCGGDDNVARSAQEQNAYDAGRTNCADFGLQETARQLGVDSSTPEEVADAYAKEVSTADFQDASRDGCVAGLEQQLERKERRQESLRASP